MLPFDSEDNKEVFKLDDETLKQMEDSYATATLDFIEGVRQGYRMGIEKGYDEGLDVGWMRGRDDIIHQLKRYISESSYDPTLEKILEDIVGE